jgi:hypothetical protein
MYTIFSEQLLLGLLALLIIYFTGKIVVGFFDLKGNFFFKLFITNIAGITTILLFYSSIKAQGRTSNILLLPSIAFLFYHFRTSLRKPIFESGEIMKEFMWTVVPFLLVYLYQSWFYFDFSKGSFKSLYADSYWYSSYGDSVDLWGVENYFTPMNFFFKTETTGLVPYHYPEFWLTSLFSRVFSISTIQSNYLLVLPLFISFFILGISSLFQLKFANKSYSILFSSILLFCCGIVFPFYGKFSLLAYSDIASDCSPMGLYGLKYSFIIPYLFLAFLLFFQRFEIPAILLFAIIPFFYVGLLPSIWGGLLVYLLIQFIVNRLKSKQNSFLFPSILFLNIFLFVLFYSFHKSVFSSDFAFKFAIEKFFKNGHPIFHNIRPFVNNIIVYSIRIVVVFIPTLLLLPLLVRKNGKPVLLGTLMIGCGIVTSSFYLGFSDGNQFANNSFIIIPLLFLFGLWYLFEFLNEQHNIYKMIGIVSIAFYLIYSVSWNIKKKKIGETWYHEDTSFLKIVAKTMKENNSCVLVFLDSNDYRRNNFISWHIQNDFYEIKQYTNKRLIYSLGNPELYLAVNTLSIVDSFTFYKLTPVNVWKNKSKNNTFKSFVEHFKINYFYFKAGVAIPEYLKQIADTVIESPLTKNKFLVHYNNKLGSK